MPLGLDHVDPGWATDHMIDVAWPNTVEVVHHDELRAKLVELLADGLLRTDSSEPPDCDVRFAIREPPQAKRGRNQDQACRNRGSVGNEQANGEDSDCEKPGYK